MPVVCHQIYHTLSSHNSTIRQFDKSVLGARPRQTTKSVTPDNVIDEENDIQELQVQFPQPSVHPTTKVAATMDKKSQAILQTYTAH